MATPDADIRGDVTPDASTDVDFGEAVQVDVQEADGRLVRVEELHGLTTVACLGHDRELGPRRLDLPKGRPRPPGG